MPSHIVKDTGSRYGNDVQIDAGDGDKISLVRGYSIDKDIINYDFTLIASKLRQFQVSWQTLTPGFSVEYDVYLGANAKLANPSSGDEIQALQNVVDGQTGVLLISGGAHSPDWDNSWDFGDPGVPTIISNPSKYSIINWVQKGSKTLASLGGDLEAAQVAEATLHSSHIVAGRPYITLLSPVDAGTDAARRLHIRTFSNSAS